MKGYYVVWKQDTEEFSGRGAKAAAIKRGKEIYRDGLDENVFIQRFDDDNWNGYFAGEAVIFIRDIYQDKGAK